MNRAQRRKIAKRTGLSYKEVRTIEEKLSPIPTLQEGDEVKVNVERIKNSPRWGDQNPKYVDFVEAAGDKIFTVVKEEKYSNAPIVSLEEDTNEPRWLFYEGDLIKVEKAETLVDLEGEDVNDREPMAGE